MEKSTNNIIDDMNYRYNNPEFSETLSIDKELVELFAKKIVYDHIERNVKEQFGLWAGMSKENKNNEFENILNNINIEKESSKAK